MKRGRILKTGLTGLLALTLPVVVRAQFNFVTNNGAITVTRYTGPGGDVMIPTSTNGLPVIGIGNHAFYYNPTVASVMIPDSITNIGSFQFFGCSRLTNIAVSALNPTYSDAAGVLFNKTQTALMQYPRGRGGSYTIPSSVTNLGTAAFTTSGSLSDITIPDSVASIGEYAFYECTNVTSIKIGKSITQIPTYAFAGIFSLTNITIESSVASIGGYAFAYCWNLAGVFFQRQHAKR